MINTRNLERVINVVNNEIERHAVGAWRAGYDYLHVFRNDDIPHDFAFKWYVLPSNWEDPPTTDVGIIFVRTYDLTQMTRDMASEVMSHE